MLLKYLRINFIDSKSNRACCGFQSCRLVKNLPRQENKKSKDLSGHHLKGKKMVAARQRSIAQ
jgi:hypothetical protein